MQKKFCRIHLLLIPGALGLLALLSYSSGLDYALENAFYDPAIAGFPVRHWRMLELFGHRIAKNAISVIWFGLLMFTIGTYFKPEQQATWASRRTALWAALAGMALGPMLVVALKGMNSYRCPWSLQEFGGAAEFTTGWFVAAAEAGHCFPAGHAASGFSFIAFYFLARATGEKRLAWLALCAALLIGGAFSLLRMAQGAHFLSHNLWAAAICWWVAAAAFLPLRIRNFSRSFSGATQ